MTLLEKTQCPGAESQPQQRFRVLHVISGIDPQSGGPTAALCGIARAQVRAGLDVSVVSTWHSEGELRMADQLRADGIQVEMVGPTRRLLRRHPRLAQTVHDAVNRSHVVHIHALWEDIQHRAASAARRQGVPYVIRPCGMLDPWSLRQHWLRKQMYLALRMRGHLNHAAALHFTSAEERESSQRLKLRAPAIIEPLGLQLDEFRQLPHPAEFRREFPRLGDSPYVIFFSRVAPNKGLGLLVPAFARAAQRGEKLVIAGPDVGGYTAQVRGIVARHGLDDRVVFTGMLRGRQRVAALAGARLFVLPSEHENFGIAVAEAMASGCPVIVSNCVNIHQEITGCGGGGSVPLDLDDLSREVSRWLQDEALCALGGAKAREFALSQYDWDHIGQRWARHYQQLLMTALPAGAKH